MFFNLGDKVVFTDYMVRADLREEQILEIKKAWKGMPDGVLEDAIKENEKEQSNKNSNPQRYWRYKKHYRVWVPYSIADKSYVKPWGHLGIHRKKSQMVSLKFPVEGIVTQKIQVQDGLAFNDGDYGSGLIRYSTTVGYMVAYRLDRKPLLVIPEFMERRV